MLNAGPKTWNLSSSSARACNFVEFFSIVKRQTWLSNAHHGLCSYQTRHTYTYVRVNFQHLDKWPLAYCLETWKLESTIIFKIFFVLLTFCRTSDKCFMHFMTSWSKLGSLQHVVTHGKILGCHASCREFAWSTYREKVTPCWFWSEKIPTNHLTWRHGVQKKCENDARWSRFCVKICEICYF